MTTESPSRVALRAMHEHLKYMQENAKACGKLLRSEAKMVAILEALDVSLHCDLNYRSVDIIVTGDGAKLKAVWRVLRVHGWTPDERPAEKEAYFSTFWRKPDRSTSFFLRFSSTVCERVQVGTETKEVPVYELQCKSGSTLPLGELS